MSNSDLPSSVDPKILHAMQQVAKMREAADRNNIGFIGGFVLPNGDPFIMTNMENDIDPEEFIRKKLLG